MDTGMYGVVLWSDPDVRKAVIWCEDGGHLAYYEAPEEPWQPQAFFDAGDYVEFEMTDDVAPLRARNAQMIRSAECPRVARTLQARGGIPSGAETRLRDLSAGQVISLSEHHTAPPRTAGDLSRRG